MLQVLLFFCFLGVWAKACWVWASNRSAKLAAVRLCDIRCPLLQNTWTSGIGPTLPLLNKHNILLSSASCISSQGCFPYLIRAFPAAVACGRISFPKIQSLKATQHPPQNHVFRGSLARNSPCIWSGLVFAGRTQHHGLFVATRQPHALNRTANISDTGLAAEEIAVPLRSAGTTSREGLPIRNQSYGTWKGLRQILIIMTLWNCTASQGWTYL